MRLLALLAATLLVQNASALAVESVAVGPIIAGESLSLPSAINGSTIELNIWLPPGYAKGGRFGVLYVVDGGLDQDFPHISGLGQLGAISGNFDELIVVGIATTNRLGQLTFAPADPRFVRSFRGAGESGKFRRVIAEEIIPFIDHRYRTGERRAIIGESLAGLFIVETFLKEPQLFTDYVAVSPSLWWDAKRLTSEASGLLARHDTTPRRLYLTMADEGGTMQNALDALVAALKCAPPKGLDWTYIDRRDSEHHSTIYHPAALDALRKLFGRPAEPRPNDAELPWYLIEGSQPPAE